MHDASSKGAINYLNLARELIQRNEKAKTLQEENVADVI